jgi:hypothetical protein
LEFFDCNAVLFEQQTAAFGTNLGQLVRRLVVEFAVFIVYFFEKQFIFILGAIEEGPGFHGATPEFSFLDRDILICPVKSKTYAKCGQIRKAFMDNGFCMPRPERLSMPVSHFGTLAAMAAKAIVSKAFPGRPHVLFWDTGRFAEQACRQGVSSPGMSHFGTIDESAAWRFSQK